MQNRVRVRSKLILVSSHCKARYMHVCEHNVNDDYNGLSGKI